AKGTVTSSRRVKNATQQRDELCGDCYVKVQLPGQGSITIGASLKGNLQDVVEAICKYVFCLCEAKEQHFEDAFAISDMYNRKRRFEVKPGYSFFYQTITTDKPLPMTTIVKDLRDDKLTLLFPGFFSLSKS